MKNTIVEEIPAESRILRENLFYLKSIISNSCLSTNAVMKKT